MDKTISRRGVLGGALLAPVAQPAAAAVAQILGSDVPGPVADPLVERCAAWIASREAVDAMIREWQSLESALFDHARKMGIKTEKACRSRMPEARTMRALNRKIEVGYLDLEREAAEIRVVAARTVEGAIAKIELGLKVQGPYDWRDDALELAEEGIAELRTLRKGEISGCG